MFAPARWTNESVVAEIDSPPFMATGDNCKLRFYVYKNSENSTLLVRLFNTATGKEKLLDRLVSGGNDFHRLSYTISQDARYIYKVYLTGNLNLAQHELILSYFL